MRTPPLATVATEHSAGVPASGRLTAQSIASLGHGPGPRMRIGIVNDSVLACEALRRVVLWADGHVVAWVARDGDEAVSMAHADPPDIILMDLFMPRMDGVEATRRIMNQERCAILVVTATVSGHISKVYQAMGYGALDAVDTPVLGTHGGLSGAAPLLRKIDIISRLIEKAPTAASTALRSLPRLPTRPGTAGQPLILIGSSTGGPFALAEILAQLPGSLKASVVIVQHVDAAFAPGLAQWLGEHTRRTVELITEGSSPVDGRILLSGTDDHLVVEPDGRFHYTAEPRSASFRPSIDVFFKSAAPNWSEPGIAVLLTGMGRDGAEGLLELHRRGWTTIAQDESTSVVWGMPRAAIELEAADFVLPLPRIAPAITELLAEPSRAQLARSPKTLESTPSGVLE